MTVAVPELEGQGLSQTLAPPRVLVEKLERLTADLSAAETQLAVYREQLAASERAREEQVNAAERYQRFAAARGEELAELRGQMSGLQHRHGDPGGAEQAAAAASFADLVEELDRTRSQLLAREIELRENQAELQRTNAGLAICRADLAEAVPATVLADINAELHRTKLELRARETKLRECESELQTLHTGLAVCTADLETARGYLATAEAHLGQAREQSSAWQARHDALVASDSWRVMRPFRVLSRALRGKGLRARP